MLNCGVLSRATEVCAGEGRGRNYPLQFVNFISSFLYGQVPISVSLTECQWAQAHEAKEHLVHKMAQELNRNLSVMDRKVTLSGIALATFLGADSETTGRFKNTEARPSSPS